MHPTERPDDPRPRVLSNVPRAAPPSSGDDQPPPGRSQAQVATRRITYIAVISVGALLLMIGVDFFMPQVATLGMLILFGVIATRLPGRLRVRGRQIQRLAATLRRLARPSPTRYVLPVAPPVTPPSPSPSSPSPRVYADPMSHEAVIRGTYRATSPADGDPPHS